MNYFAVGVIVTVGTGFKMSISKTTDFYLTSRLTYISFPVIVAKLTATATTTRARRTTGFTIGATTTNFSY